VRRSIAWWRGLTRSCAEVAALKVILTVPTDNSTASPSPSSGGGSAAGASAAAAVLGAALAWRVM